MRARSRIVAAALVAFAVSACGSPNNVVSYVRPTATPSAPQRGKIEALFEVGVLKKAVMERGQAGQVISELGGAPACDVKLYSIRYETIGVHGERADASAAFFVPDTGCKGPFPMIGYAHGTLFVRSQSMTHAASTHPPHTLPDPESIVVAAIYAAHGYAVAATDYLGLGLSSYPYHPYLHADSEASAIVDAMRAARTAAARLHVRLSGRVFLNGYSQGGHSTMAAQRTIESQNLREFDLRGVAPASGPYALEQGLVDSVGHPTLGAPVYATYILTAFEQIYGNVYSDPTEVFKPPYANGITSLIPVATFADEAALSGKTLPLSLARLLQPAFTKSFLKDPTNGARSDAFHNGLLHGWTARTPMFLCGGKRDPVVNFENAREADAYFKLHGNGVRLLDVDPYIPASVPLSLYHDAVLVFCEPLARIRFFDPLK